MDAWKDCMAARCALAECSVWVNEPWTMLRRYQRDKLVKHAKRVKFQPTGSDLARAYYDALQARAGQFKLA